MAPVAGDDGYSAYGMERVYKEIKKLYGIGLVSQVLNEIQTHNETLLST